MQCGNCKSERTPADKYCNNCGQKLNERLTMRMVFESFANTFFSFDSKLFQTLPPFFLQPGQIPLEFVCGRRKTYIPPISMYVFLSFLFFMVFSTLFVKQWDQKVTEIVTQSVFQHLNQV